MSDASIFETLNWNEVWKDCFDHYQQDLRHAYYVNAFLENDDSRILEIGAGSFRDMHVLNSLGKQCFGIDASSESVRRAKEIFPDIKEKIIEANAFHLPFENKSFEVSYSNGVIGCFADEKIHQLLEEQFRVTKKKMIVTVHNAHNSQFVNYFEQKKQADPIFCVRFFTVSDMKKMLIPYSSNIQIIPVGKGKKTYEDDLINIGLFDAQSLRKEFDYHGMNLLDRSERLLCIANLDN